MEPGLAGTVLCALGLAAGAREERTKSRRWRHTSATGTGRKIRRGAQSKRCAAGGASHALLAQTGWQQQWFSCPAYCMAETNATTAWMSASDIRRALAAITES